MKPTSVVEVVVLVCILTAPLSANDWIGGGGDNLWDNPLNWSQGVVPLGAWQHPGFGWDDPACPCYPLTPDPSDDAPLWNNDAILTADNATILIDEDTVATAYGVRIGFHGASNTLQMTGGRLEVGGIPPGQSDRVGWHLDVGRGYNWTANPNPVARFEMTGGIVDTNLIKVPEGFVDESLPDPYDTPGLNGEFIVSGGTIIGRKLNLGQFTGNGYGEISGDAKIFLWPSVASDPNNAGHFEMKQNWFIQGQPVPTVADAYLDIRQDAVIYIFGNIDEFKMTPDQSELDRYQQYVDDGWLTANNGADAPDITLQPCPDDGSFDEYCLSDMMITISAPVPVIPGDFDDNGAHECADVDALVAEIVAGTHTVSFDLTDDGLVDHDDLAAWLGFAGTALGYAGPVLPADANLDGTVDGQDFLGWNNFKFSSSNGFCGGDFNADGTTDGGDFLIWNNFKFQSSDGVAAVPEPAGWALAIGAYWFGGSGIGKGAHRSRRRTDMKWFHIFALVGLLAGLSTAPTWANLWTGAGADDLWTNVDNWSQGLVPLGAWQHPGTGWDDPACPCYPLTSDPSDDGPAWNNDVKLQTDGTVTLIDETVTLAMAYGVRVGNGGANNVLHVTGGRLDIGGTPPTGGDRVGWHLQVGRGYPGFDGGPINVDPTATVLMSGGTINTNGLLIPEQFVDHSLPDPTDSAPLNGELIMSGGTINARWMNLGQLKGNGRAELSGDAVINLWPNLVNQPNNGGHLSFNRDWFLFGQPVPSSGMVSFDIRDNAAVYIFGHESQSAGVPNQVEVSRYQGYVDDGTLTANGGTEAPIITLEPCPDDGSLDEYCVNAQRMMITITAPLPLIPGDFDDNGQHECADVDALVAEIVAGNHTASFDLTDDGLVDQADLAAWLGFAGTALGFGGPVLPADSDLNGTVDGGDFLIWNNFKFTADNGFCGGDLNADGTTDGGDFLIWNNHKFTSSDVRAVPEPGCWALAIGALVWWQRYRRMVLTEVAGQPI